MARVNIKKGLFEVTVIGHDRWSGPETLQKFFVDNEQEAIRECALVNSKNTKTVVPEYYETASYRKIT